VACGSPSSPSPTQLVLTAAAWGGFLTALDGHRPDGPAALLGGIARLLGAGGAPWPAVLLGLAGALLVAALGLLAGPSPCSRRSPGAPSAAAGAGQASGCGGPADGRVTVKVDPRASSLSTRTAPPWASAT
jgi:hypothetical protein